jgi:NADPH:quinone reductase-like Zn-dependent oxidoreductase
MHAVRYHEHGGPEQLTVEELDRPEPAAGELLICVAAAGVNPVDTYFRDGEYPVPELPWVPGCDAAGEVVAVGDGVNEFTVGDRVVATGLGRTTPGACAEYVTAPTGLAARLPDGVGFEAAAALALVGTTAWQAFVHHGDVGPGERVLVHGANGGVGHVAVQLARAMGADVTATARPAFEADLQALGADAVVDYRTEDLADALAAPGAPNVVLGTVANETIAADAAAAAHGARIIAIGNTEPTVAVPMGPGKFKDLRFQAMSMFNTPDTAAVLGKLARLVDRGDVEPVVAATYDFDEVADAHRDVLAASFLGKLVVTP